MIRDLIVTGVSLTVAAVISAPVWLPVDPAAVLAQAGGSHVTVVSTDDPALNCAAHVGGGCFRPATPTTIYLSPSLRGGALRYVTLHEWAHVQQHAAGRPLDECEADRMAVEAGADPAWAHYLPTCGGAQ